MRSRFRRSLWCVLACLIVVPGVMWAHDPHDPFVTIAVSPNFAQDNTLFAATDLLSLKIDIYMLLKSTDGGVNWSVVAGLPNNNRMTSIAISPAYSQDHTVVVAGVGGLYVTTNQGSSWNLVLKSKMLYVALSPNFAKDNTLFVVTSQKTLIMSTNRGKSWKPVPLPMVSGFSPVVIAISPNYTSDKTLLLGSTANGIFKSTNGGSSWTQSPAGQNLPPVTALSFSPNFSADDTAFATTYGSGVLVSTDAGSSWTPANSGITDLSVTSLAFSPTYAQDSTLWVTSATAGLSVSSTAGDSWAGLPNVSRTLSALTTTHYQGVAAAATSTGRALYLVMYEGLWISTNNGAAWQYIDTLPTRLVRHINMSPNYANDQTIFVSTYGSGNLWSFNGGTNWSFRNTGMLRPYTDGSAISPNFAADGVAFSGDDQGLQRTTDGAASWKLMQGLGVPAYPRAVAVSPNFANDSTVLIGLAPTSSPNTGVYLSNDGGNTWLNTSLTGVQPVISLAFSPAFATDRTAYAGSDGYGLYRSTDGGMTWNILSAVPAHEMAGVVVSPAFATDNTVFAWGLIGGIYKSTDRGNTWSTLANTTALRALDVQISPNYTADQTLFAGTMQMGLVEFTQGGATMTPLTSFPDQLVTAMGISPNFAADGTLFAAAYHGLYKSTDSGSTWTSLVSPARIEESQNVKGPLQEPPTIVFQGSWSEVAAANSSCDGIMQTAASQDSSVLSFTGTAVALVTWIGPNQGTLSIQVDGGSPQSVSLTAPMDQYQQTVWQQQNLACGNHTVTLTALPSSGQTVSLDAFNVWVTGCPLR